MSSTFICGLNNLGKVRSETPEKDFTRFFGIKRDYGKVESFSHIQTLT